MTTNLLVWSQGLKPGDVIPGAADKPEILVTTCDLDPTRSRICRIGRASVIFWMRPLDDDAVLVEILPWGVSRSPSRDHAIQHVVLSVEDVAFHLHEVATEAAAGRWS